jgi:hypothetical protein
MTERLLTADEVAELLSVPVSWVRESTRSGRSPVCRLAVTSVTTGLTWRCGSRSASGGRGEGQGDG